MHSLASGGSRSKSHRERTGAAAVKLNSSCANSDSITMNSTVRCSRSNSMSIKLQAATPAWYMRYYPALPYAL